MSAAVSAGSSGSSQTVVEFSLPWPQPDRRSSSSGRARQTIRIGAPRLKSATCSIRSSSAGSPHCRSSNTATSGESSPELSKRMRTAHAISAGEVTAACSPSRTLTAAATLASRLISPAAPPHPCSASSSCLTIETTAQ